jgi:hypothetical protein
MGKFLKIIRYIAKTYKAIMGACFSNTNKSSNLNEPLLKDQGKRSDFNPDQEVFNPNDVVSKSIGRTSSTGDAVSRATVCSSKSIGRTSSTGAAVSRATVCSSKPDGRTGSTGAAVSRATVCSSKSTGRTSSTGAAVSRKTNGLQITILNPVLINNSGPFSFCIADGKILQCVFFGECFEDVVLYLNRIDSNYVLTVIFKKNALSTDYNLRSYEDFLKNSITFDQFKSMHRIPEKFLEILTNPKKCIALYY